MAAGDRTEMQGIVHGKTIELAESLDLPDGQVVTVTVRPVLPPGEGIRQSAGAWADGDEDLTHWLEETYQSRKHGWTERPS